MRESNNGPEFFVGMIIAGFCLLMFSAGFIDKGVQSIPPAYRKESVKPEKAPKLAPLEYTKEEGYYAK